MSSTDDIERLRFEAAAYRWLRTKLTQINVEGELTGNAPMHVTLLQWWPDHSFPLDAASVDAAIKDAMKETP